MSKTITRQIKPATLPGTTSDALQDYEIRHMALARRAAAEGFVLLENKTASSPCRGAVVWPSTGRAPRRPSRAGPAPATSMNGTA